MKRFTFFLSVMLLMASLTITAQPPQAFKYKAIARDKYGRLIVNKKVAMRISLLQDNENGMAVYVETHTPWSNAFGVIELEIGRGTPQMGTFSMIDWGTGDYYIKIEMDPKNKPVKEYSVIGTSQLLSVPYALYAGHVQNSEDNDADPMNELITNAYLSGTILTILEGGNTTFIDLSGLQNGTDDADADPENEIQDLQLTGDILTITKNGSATAIDLIVFRDNTDAQTLSLSGNDLSISGGNMVTLPDEVDDADNDPLNEIQSLSLSGNTLSLTNGGSVVLPISGSIVGQYYYADKDGDDFGYRFSPVYVPQGITEPVGFVANNTDCNDEEAEINPNAIEIQGDGLDNDCDGAIDELEGDFGIDDDGDGFSEDEGDCDDADAAINPVAVEICEDGIDQNCDGDDGTCGYGQLVYNEVTILPETVTEANPSTHQIALNCDLPFDVNSLTAEARIVYEAGNVGGTSLIAESLAMEILKRYVNSQLHSTGQEIVYVDSRGKTFDYMVSIYDQNIAVEVTRVYVYPDMVMSIDQCEALLTQKLDDLNYAVSNTSQFKPEKAILVVFTPLQENVNNLMTAISNLDPIYAADTMILLVLTQGDDAFIY